MFELGFFELVVVAIIGVLVLGPQQVPVVMHKIGKWMRQLGYTRFALERQFEAFMDKEDQRERRAIEHKTNDADKPSDGTA